MRKLIMSAVLAAATAPILLIGAGAASAHAQYGEFSASANGDGASSAGTFSSAGDDYWGHGYGYGWGHWEGYHHGWYHEGPSYLQTCAHADRDGASSGLTATGVDATGHAYYLQSAQDADSNGANSSTTGSRS
ncbi:hypothetical protein ACEZDB_00950 [Streptacidiphilus sp. N1-3]|uniref:Lactococcin 972 family bacteriocin n=1 Tax=Streptacidiphilus alkalitolerans TaxID=3342712 RepID=A0ABV6WT66_9ACTN